jgi:hypothetical protein
MLFSDIFQPKIWMVTSKITCNITYIAMIAGSLEITTYLGKFLPKRVHPWHTCMGSLLSL